MSWTYPKEETLNNPLLLGRVYFPDETGTNELTGYISDTVTKLCTVQSTNTGGDALYIVQLNVTIRESKFIPIASSYGAAAFGEENVLVDNYKPSKDPKKRKEEGLKAHETANKKRKINNVRSLSLPTLDSK